MAVNNFEDGTLCYVIFGKTIGHEINADHLGTLFNVRGVNNNMVFCIPLTSAKDKHFKTQKDFDDRNYQETKYYYWHYIKETDSIAQLEQIRMVSGDRLRCFFEEEDTKKIIVLSTREMDLLKSKALNFIKNILYK